MDLGLLFVLLMPVAFYFLLVRPQQRRVKERQALVSSISSGDRVVTIGGLHGTVVSIDEETAGLEIDDDVIITVERAAVARRLVDADTGDLRMQSGDHDGDQDDAELSSTSGTDDDTQARAHE